MLELGLHTDEHQCRAWYYHFVETLYRVVVPGSTIDVGLIVSQVGGSRSIRTLEFPACSLHGGQNQQNVKERPRGHGDSK